MIPDLVVPGWIVAAAVGAILGLLWARWTR